MDCRKACRPVRTMYVIMVHDVNFVYIIEFLLNKVFNIVYSEFNLPDFRW